MTYPALGVGQIAEWTCATCGKRGEVVTVDKTAALTAILDHEKQSDCNGNIFVKARKE